MKLAVLLDGTNSSIVRSTRIEHIGRIFAFASESVYVAYVSNSIGDCLASEAHAGNNRAMQALAMWTVILYCTMVLAREHKLEPPGPALIYIILVDWFIRRISPRQAYVAGVEEEVLLTVKDDLKQ